MRGRRDWFIRVPWGKLALVGHGHPDGDPVFLVHGRQDSSSVFEPLIEQMPEQYYFVALDMPGNGLSDAFPPGPKLMRFHFLAAMEMAIKHLGWDKFMFVGHSMGCEQGLFYSVIHPGQITKMILLDAGPTLMRMQVQNHLEYQRYYDDYYQRYEWENFERKPYIRELAIQALKRHRELTGEQCEVIITRNFHGFPFPRPFSDFQGVPVYDTEEMVDNAQSSIVLKTDKTRSIKLKTKKLAPLIVRLSNKAKIKHEDRRCGGASTSANEGLIEPKNMASIYKNRERKKNYKNTLPRQVQNREPVWVLRVSGKKNSNGKRNEDEGQNANTNGTQDTNEQNAEEARSANVAQNPDAPGDLSGFIQHMRDDDEVGYLSWDNRLKNLAPQNYGNDYYFALFKTIPPTLLIAASDGAKSAPPNPIWRQGAKELLDRMATLDNFHRVDVEGSHDVHFTHPERVLPYINAFFQDSKLSCKL